MPARRGSGAVDGVGLMVALASGVAGGVDGVEGEMARPEEGSGADGIGAGRAIEDVASRAKRVRTT